MLTKLRHDRQAVTWLMTWCSRCSCVNGAIELTGRGWGGGCGGGGWVPLPYKPSCLWNFQPPPQGGVVVTWPLDRKFVDDLNKKTKTDTSILYSLCGGLYTPFRTSHPSPFWPLTSPIPHTLPSALLFPLSTSSLYVCHSKSTTTTKQIFEIWQNCPHDQIMNMHCRSYPTQAQAFSQPQFVSQVELLDQ